MTSSTISTLAYRRRWDSLHTPTDQANSISHCGVNVREASKQAISLSSHLICSGFPPRSVIKSMMSSMFTVVVVVLAVVVVVVVVVWCWWLKRKSRDGLIERRLRSQQQLEVTMKSGLLKRRIWLEVYNASKLRGTYM